MSSKLLSGLLSVALVAAPLNMAYAGPVEDLYSQGQEKFDAGDFGAAADLWAQAVRAVDEGPDSATRQTIMNLALDAYLRAYRASEDRKYADDAKKLLDEYEALLEGSGVELSPELVDAKGKIQEILDKYAAEEEEAARKAAEEEAARKAAEDEAARKAAAEANKKPPGRPLIIGGAVGLGVGAAGIGLAVGGAVGGLGALADYKKAEDDGDTAAQNAAEKRGRTMNALAITGAVVAPLFIGAGVALLIIGLKKNKAASKSSAMVLPAAGPGFTGLTLTGRF
ncbi:MAG: hypothetical protein KC457_06300 [Myxococcales bacterium]|nr:hypothetical protein [Myxococcales bacterium]